MLFREIIAAFVFVNYYKHTNIHCVDEIKIFLMLQQMAPLSLKKITCLIFLYYHKLILLKKFDKRAAKFLFRHT
jgi:hypothetical protein